MNDIEENRRDIDVNRDNIEDNAENLQDYFKDTMNFDAVRLIEHAYLEHFAILPDGPLVVEINGNKGYVCDTDGTVGQHTADLLCQKVGYPAGAQAYGTKGEHLKMNIS